MTQHEKDIERRHFKTLLLSLFPQSYDVINHRLLKMIPKIIHQFQYQSQ